MLVTKNLVPGESVYGEKRITIATPNAGKSGFGLWPFTSHRILTSCSQMAARTRPSSVSGTLSEASWLLVFWEVLTTFTFDRVPRCSTSEPLRRSEVRFDGARAQRDPDILPCLPCLNLAVPRYLMSPTLSDPREPFTPSNSLTEVDVISSTWPRRGPTSSPSSRTLVTPQNTGCSSAWSMSSLPMVSNVVTTSSPGTRG